MSVVFTHNTSKSSVHPSTLADSGGGAGGARPPPFEIPKRVFKEGQRGRRPPASPLLKFQRGSSNGTAAAPPPPFHKSWIRPCFYNVSKTDLVVNSFFIKLELYVVRDQASCPGKSLCYPSTRGRNQQERLGLNRRQVPHLSIKMSGCLQKRTETKTKLKTIALHKYILYLCFILRNSIIKTR